MACSSALTKKLKAPQDRFQTPFLLKVLVASAASHPCLRIFPHRRKPLAPATGWRVCVPRSPPAAPVRPGPRSPAPRWWRGCARHLDPRCHRLRRHMVGILGWLRCTCVICMYMYIIYIYICILQVCLGISYIYICVDLVWFDSFINYICVYDELWTTMMYSTLMYIIYNIIICKQTLWVKHSETNKNLHAEISRPICGSFSAPSGNPHEIARKNCCCFDLWRHVAIMEQTPLKRRFYEVLISLWLGNSSS